MAQINGTLELDGSTLTFRFGGANETVVSAGTPSSAITLSLPTEGSSTFATRTLAETLTNKTLTSAIAQDLQVKSSTGTGNTVTVKPSDTQVVGSSLLLDIQGGTSRTLAMGANISVTGGNMQVGAALTTAGAVNIGSTLTTVGAFSTSAAFSTAGVVSIGAAFTTVGAFSTSNAVTIAGALTTTGGALTFNANAGGSTLTLSSGTLTLSYTTGDTFTVPSGGGTAVLLAGTQTITGTKIFQSLQLNNASRTITLQTDGSATDTAVMTLRPTAASVVLSVQNPTLTFSGTGDLTFASPATARVVNIPTTFASGDEIVGRTSAQTLTAKTLTAPLITTNGSIDVTGAGTLTIAASMGANDLTLGGASSTVVIPGNLTVNGTTTTISTTNLDVEDAEISLNVGGSPATPADGVAGIRIDTALTNDPRIDYHSGVTSGWRIDKGGASPSPQEVLVAGLSQTLTGIKTFNQAAGGAVKIENGVNAVTLQVGANGASRTLTLTPTANVELVLANTFKSTGVSTSLELASAYVGAPIARIPVNWSAGDDTLIGANTAATLASKILTTPTIQAGADSYVLSAVTGASGTIRFHPNAGTRDLTLSGNLTLAANFITSGANSLTLTTTASTNVTLPATGTLATLAGTETFSAKTLTTLTTGLADTINASGDIATPSASLARITTGSSITGIDQPGSDNRWLVLINDSAGTVTVTNSNAANNDIITGTGANIAMADQSSLFLVYDQTEDRWRVVGGSGSGGSGWTQTAVKTGAYTASNNEEVPVDTNAGVVTIELPASPSAGYRVRVVDWRFTAGTNNITVTNNATPGTNLINGSLSDYIMNVNGAIAEFVFMDAGSETVGWRVFKYAV